MRQVTIYTTDKKFKHFIELAKNLHYVKKIETDEVPSDEETIDNNKRVLKEVLQFKLGKLKTISAKIF